MQTDTGIVKGIGPLQRLGIQDGIWRRQAITLGMPEYVATVSQRYAVRRADRAQMFAGVTYTFFVINAVIAIELFLLFWS